MCRPKIQRSFGPLAIFRPAKSTLDFAITKRHEKHLAHWERSTSASSAGEGDIAARFVRLPRSVSACGNVCLGSQPSVVPRHPHLPCGHPLPVGEEFSFRSRADRASHACRLRLFCDITNPSGSSCPTRRPRRIRKRSAAADDGTWSVPTTLRKLPETTAARQSTAPFAVEHGESPTPRFANAWAA